MTKTEAKQTLFALKVTDIEIPSSTNVETKLEAPYYAYTRNVAAADEDMLIVAFLYCAVYHVHAGISALTKVVANDDGVMEVYGYSINQKKEVLAYTAKLEVTGVEITADIEKFIADIQKAREEGNYTELAQLFDQGVYF